MTVVTLAGLCFACGRKIGDDCEMNVQCNPNGNRQCDLSQPGGYCTVQGCDQTSCPDKALCVRFFPAAALSAMSTCDPATEAQHAQCDVREICLQEGFCVEPRLEARFCMKACSANHDCRAGYECRTTGMGGAELLPNMDGSVPAIAHFCTGAALATIPDAGPNIPDAAIDAPIDAAVDAPAPVDAGVD